MRPSREEWAVGIAEAVSTYADCLRRLCGAIIFNDSWRIMGTGYNGGRAGVPGCLEGACPRGQLSYDQIPAFTNYDDPDSPGYCISMHAEENAMIHAGGSLFGFTMAISQPPCFGCQKKTYAAGLSRLLFRQPDSTIGEIKW